MLDVPKFALEVLKCLKFCLTSFSFLTIKSRNCFHVEWAYVFTCVMPKVLFMLKREL